MLTLIDGGTGSELRRRGVALTAGAWSAPAALEHSALLTSIHRDYVLAGADVVTANTFSASPFVLDAAGLGQRFEAVNRAAIAAALAAAEVPSDDGPPGPDAPPAGRRTRRIRVAASLSCYPPGGDPQRYPGAADELAAYRRWAAVCADAGSDLLLVEMMQDIEHGARMCLAAAETGLPYWLGLSCRRHPVTGALVGFDRPETPITDVIERLVDFGPAVVNVMHSPIDVIDEALELVAARWGGARGAYPERPYREDPSGRFDEAVDDPGAARALARHAARWAQAGATVVGGCCGTTPADIAAIRRRLDPMSGEA